MAKSLELCDVAAIYTFVIINLSRIVRKPYIRTCVRTAKIHISLDICAVWSEFSLSTFLIDKGAKLLHADNGDWSDFFVDAQADLCLIGCTSQKVRFLTLRLKLIIVQDRRALLMCLGYSAGSFVAQRECWKKSFRSFIYVVIV